MCAISNWSNMADDDARLRKIAVFARKRQRIVLEGIHKTPDPFHSRLEFWRSVERLCDEKLMHI